MGRKKVVVQKIAGCGVIIYRPGAAPTPAPPVSNPFRLPLSTAYPNILGADPQTSATTTDAVVSPQSSAPQLQRLSVFDSDLAVEPGRAKTRASKTAARRDRNALNIDGTERLDPRKTNAEEFGFGAAGGDGARTRASVKKDASRMGETNKSLASLDHTTRQASYEVDVQERMDVSTKKDASPESAGRKDSVVTGTDPTADVEMVDAPADSSPLSETTTIATSAIDRDVIAATGQEGSQMNPSAVDNGASSMAPPAPSTTSRFARELNTDLVTEDDRYVTEYSWNGRDWFRPEGTEEAWWPYWYERVIDIYAEK